MSNTSQELFNLAVRRVREQAAPSARGTDCLLRGPNGRVCAVGALLADEHYTSDLEREPVPSSLGAAPLRDAIQQSHPTLGLGHLQWVMLDHLQQAHDLAATSSGRFLDTFEEAIRGVARDFELEMPA